MTKAALLRTVVAASCATACAISTSANAQPAPQSTALEEILITAQRRTESLQSVPIAVTALSAQTLVDNDIRSLEDLTGSVPGFVATNSVTYAAAPLSIRGVGGANGGGNFFNDEPVAVYVDGVYIGRLSFSTADLLDIESIEVLRGPQGTLYGRNSTAGALLITSKRPTEALEGHVRGSATSLGEYRAEAAIGGPLVADTLKGRIALAYSDRDGWGDNVVDGSDVNSSQDFSVRGSLEFTPTPDITLNLIAEFLDREAQPGTIAVADTVSGNVTSPFTPRADFNDLLNGNDFALNDPQFTNSETISTTILLNWDLGGVILDSVSSYRKFDLDGAQDSDGTQRSLFNNFGSFRNDQYSQELRLSAPEDHALNWVAGAYYIHEDNAMNPFVINNINAFFGLGTNADFRAFQDLDAFAIFADASYEIFDGLSVTLGGRYSYERKSFENNQSVVTLRAGFFPPGMVNLPAGATVVPPTQFVDKNSWEDFSPRVVIDYRVTETVLAYASYSQGFKSGGFNSFGLTPAFNPEEVNAFEVGVKSDFLDGRARLNIAGFYYDYSDLQVRLGVPTGGVNIQNAAEAEIAGVEVEATFAPSEHLRLDASVAYLDATFDEGVLPAVPPQTNFPIGAPIPLVQEDISGNRLSRAPKWQLSFSGEYRKPVADLGDIRLRLTYFHQSNVFFLETSQIQPTFRSGSWNEVNARISFTPPDEQWELAIFGQNIFDDRHITQITQLGSFPNAAINEPAKIGIEARFNF